MRMGDLKVNIEKPKLLEKLKTNRETHLAEWKTAMEGWRETVKEEAEALIKVLDDGGIPDFSEFKQHFAQPENHTREYDVAIHMLDMSSDNIIELNQTDFECYVRDSWEWKRSWSMSNRVYVTKMSSK